MPKLFSIIALGLLACSPAFAQGVSQSSSQISESGKETLNVVGKFIANQASMAGAAGVCQPAAYTLIHICTMRMVEDQMTKIQQSGPEGDRLASIIKNSASDIWRKFVSEAHDRQSGGAPPMSCAQVMENVRAFGQAYCVKPNSSSATLPNQSGQPNALQQRALPPQRNDGDSSVMRIQ